MLIAKCLISTAQGSFCYTSRQQCFKLCKHLVDFGIEGGSSLLILSDRIKRVENFFFLMRIATQVDVATLFVQQIISGIFLRLEVFAVRNYLSIVPPSQ